MEAAGLIIGSAGLLIQAVETTVTCMQLLRQYQEVSGSNAVMNCKLHIEQHRLTQWARNCGLHDGGLDQSMPMRATRDVALEVLGHMLDIVAETEELRERYGMNSIVRAGSNSEKLEREYGSLVDAQANTHISETMITRKMSEANDRDNISPRKMENYRKLQRSLEKKRSTLGFMKKCRWVITDGKKFGHMISELHYFNDALENLIRSTPGTRTSLETSILSSTPDHGLKTLEIAAGEFYPTLARVASMKNTVFEYLPTPDGSLPQRTGPLVNLEIKLEHLDLRRKSKPRTMATYDAPNRPSREVLIEWRNFEYALTEVTRKKTAEQADNLARILSQQPKPAAFRILNCLGYCIADDRVGYVFEMPANANSSSSPRALSELLWAPESSTSIDKPPLEDRFALGQALCRSVYYLHLSELVHKGIRPNNILFFRREGEKRIRLDEPYLTGFDYSRLDAPGEATITQIASSADDNRYRHPEFHTAMSKRSTKIHDLYSLGLVLLEIAMWAAVQALAENRQGPEIRNYLLAKDSPIDELDHRVGTTFQNVVVKCLRGDFDTDIAQEPQTGELQREFLHEVVCEMDKCRA